MSPIRKLIKMLRFGKNGNNDCPVICRKELDVSDKLLGLLKRLQDAGYEAYIVGGAVRDLLLHREPKDYDVATSATPEQIRNVFGRRQARIIGKRFRLVHVYLGQAIIEVSTFRRTPSSPGKMPAPLKKRSGVLPGKLIFDDNSFGTALQDAFRRDFTVNALFYDPFSQEIKDYTGMGLADIESGTVRVIGDAAERFEEDPVRLLRALKLIGQYGFEFEEKTGSVLREKISMITHASPSRLALELEKILKAQYSHKILEVFHDYGMLKYFLPELERVYETDTGRLILELLAVRNKRVAEGCYKSSISIPMAILALPGISAYTGVGTGMLWNADILDYNTAADIVRSAVAPHAMMRCLTEMAAGALRLLPELAADGGRRRVNQALRQHAVELFNILNTCIWKSTEAAENLLVADEDLAVLHKKRRRRYCRRRGRKKTDGLQQISAPAKQEREEIVNG